MSDERVAFNGYTYDAEAWAAFWSASDDYETVGSLRGRLDRQPIATDSTPAPGISEERFDELLLTETVRIAKEGGPIPRNDAIDALASEVRRLRQQVEAARIVAEDWRASMVAGPGETRWAAHPLCMVLGALNGETDPVELGIGIPSAAATALRALGSSHG